VTVKVINEEHDERSLSWVGKVEHQIKFEKMEVKRLTMTALAHEIGVYDINHLKFEVYTEGKTAPAEVKLRDELIVQILAEAP